MAGWGIDVDGLDESERALARLAALMLDLRPFWPKVVPIWIRAEKHQFETEGAYFGTPWQPLSPGYAAWKARRFPGKGILIAEGDLRKGVSTPERIALPRSLQLIVKWEKKGRRDRRGRFLPTDRLDPDWHHSGTEGKGGHLPPRPIFAEVMPPEAQRDFDEAAEDYVAEMARRVGL